MEASCFLIKKCKNLQCSCLNDTAIKRTVDVHIQCHRFRFLLIPQETEAQFGTLEATFAFHTTRNYPQILKQSFSFIFNDRCDSNVSYVHFEVFVFVSFFNSYKLRTSKSKLQHRKNTDLLVEKGFNSTNEPMQQTCKRQLRRNA